MLCLNVETKHVLKLSKIYFSENQKLNQLKRNCTLLEPFSKTKFNQLHTNYSGSYLWNRIMPRQNTNLEQSATLKVFIENFENYPFIPDSVTRSFCFVLYYEDHNLTIN